MALNVPISNSALNTLSPHRDPNVRGVFSNFPMMTPKYAMHGGDRGGDFTETQARMYMQVNPKEYDSFVAGLPEDTRDIMKALATPGGGGRGYIDFLLQSCQQGFTENMQIHETLSDNYVAFFFGQSPPVFQYTGTLYNTFQDDWAMRMLRIYRDLTRGSQLAKSQKLIQLSYDSLIVSGAMSQFSWTNTAEMQTACTFSFTLLVKELRIVLGGLTPPTTLKASGQGDISMTTPAATSATTVLSVPAEGTPPGAATADAPLKNPYATSTGTQEAASPVLPFIEAPKRPDENGVIPDYQPDFSGTNIF